MYRARYHRIIWFFARVFIHLTWWDIFLPLLGLKTIAKRSRPDRLRRIAARFRILAVQLGGVLIKVGQWLSARLDVLPHEITDELAGLQDEVQPADFDEIRRVIETEFSVPLEARFSWIDSMPVAAASIGQVHRAQMVPFGETQPVQPHCPTVVVKVQRPNIEAIVETDLAALRVVIQWVALYPPVRRRVDLHSLMAEFSRSLHEEVDYLHEGKNAETFAANFSHRVDVCVPLVYWSHTTRRVLTLEDVQGIKITDYEAIEAAGIDRRQVAKRLFEVYLKQVFDDRFFHADPHPGNLFVLPAQAQEDQPPDWKLVFVDFGMAGQITPNLLAGLREMVFAVAERDPDRVIKAYQMMSVLLPGADLELLRQANQSAFERFWGKTTSELMRLDQSEAIAFLSDFRELLYNAPFQLPENMILLGRCLSILNGICTGLDENFNVWTSVVPYAGKLAPKNGGKLIETWLLEFGELLRTLANLPLRTNSLLSRMERGQLEVRSPELKTQMNRLERGVRRLSGTIIFAALLFAGVQFYLGGDFLLAGGFGLAALLVLGLSFFIP